MKYLIPIFVVIDVGLPLYWVWVFIQIYQEGEFASDFGQLSYFLVNTSFLNIDMAIAVTGLASIYAYLRHYAAWRVLAILSLAFTSFSGYFALALWFVHHNMDPLWLVSNMFLAVYPMVFLFRFYRGKMA